MDIAPDPWARQRASAPGRRSKPRAYEDALVRRARTEPAAFGELYDRYVGRVHAFVTGQVSDRAAAEDVTADVFLRALRAIGGSRQRGRPCSAWLYGIALDAVADHHRDRQPRSEQARESERSGCVALPVRARRRTAG